MLAKAAARFGIHYGWVVVGMMFAVLVTAAGVQAIPGLIIKSLEAEFEWSRSAVSFAVALGILTYGLGGPVSGRLILRFGTRNVVAGALVLAALAAGSLVWLHTIVQLTLVWGILVGLAIGMLAIPVGAAVANRWFVQRRGLVVGILGAGWSAGALIWVPVFMNVSLASGWRAAIVLGAAVLLALVPLVLLVVRDGPSEVGLQAYGADPASSAATATIQQVVPVSEAMRTRDFWLLAGSFFVCGLTTNGLIGTHLIPHAVEHGFAEGVAAGALALIGGFNVVGTICSGYLTDRFNPRRLLAIYYALRAASLVLLPSVSSEAGLIVFSVIFGLDYIATVPPTVALTADRFGRANLPSIFGWITFVHMIGGAVSSYGGGVARDLFGDYTLAFMLAAVFGFVAAGLSLGISPPRRSSRIGPAPATA